MKLKINFKKNIQYLVLILFIITTLLYTNINKLPLSHPGNLKAADAFYHALITEGIIDTQQWNYYDVVFSLGQEKAVNSQPPLYYLNAAILNLFSNVPVWDTLYFLISISQALFIVLIYLITIEIFDNEMVGLIGAGLSILPIPISAWLYGLYIGFWIQVPSYLFVLTFLWLFIRFLKNRENWTLIFLGVCISSVILLHPQDLMFLFIPSVIILFKILKNISKNFYQTIKKTLIFGLVPGIVFLTMLPRFLFVWGAQGGKQYGVGFYGIRNIFNRNVQSGSIFPKFFSLPIVFVVLFILGFILVALLIKKKDIGLPKYKKKKLVLPKNKKMTKPLLLWNFISLYYFIYVYLVPLFIKLPYYIGRMRALQVFIIVPFVAVALYVLIQGSIFLIVSVSNLKKTKLIEFALVLFITILPLVLAFPQYKETTNRIQGEHIPLGEWKAYVWLHENTNKNDKVLFFDGTFQSEIIYTKRISASFPQAELQRIVNKVTENNVTATSFSGTWGGRTVRAVHKYEVSFLNYQTFEEPGSNFSIYDFDYVLFQDLNLQMSQINNYFSARYINEQGFNLVYDNEGYMIIKNGR